VSATIATIEADRGGATFLLLLQSGEEDCLVINAGNLAEEGTAEEEEETETEDEDATLEEDDESFLKGLLLSEKERVETERGK